MKLHRYMTAEQRFWACVRKTDSCWWWTGCADRDGYGRLRVHGQFTRAHRFSLVLHGFDVPRGALVLHSCDNPACVNPAHLRIGTAAQNTRDAIERRRLAYGDRNASRKYPERRPRGKRHHWQTKPWTRMHGERNGRAKLTWEEVEEIRALPASIPGTQIAKAFGVSNVMVSKIRRGLAWPESAKKAA